MKKMMIFAVSVLMSLTASAVEFSFAKVSEVKQVNNSFYAYTESGEAVAISAYQYTQMQDADGFYVLNVDGKKVVAAGDQFAVEKLTVDSVGLEGNLPKVFFTNGSHKVFQKDIWLKLLKGQTLRRAYLNIPTWEWENYATVDKGDVVIYHDPLAPTKKAVAEAPTAKAKDAEAATKAKAEAEAKAKAAEAAAKAKAEAEAKAKAAEAAAKAKAEAEAKAKAAEAAAKAKAAEAEAKAKAAEAAAKAKAEAEAKAKAEAEAKKVAPKSTLGNGGFSFRITH